MLVKTFPWIGLLGAIVIGTGLGVGGWFIGSGFYGAHYGGRYVSVKGLAERDVKADLAVWSLRFVASGNELATVQETIKKETAVVNDFLRQQGIGAKAVTLQGLDVTDRDAELYSGKGKADRYIIAKTLLVRSGAVGKIAAASQHVGTLVDRGVILASNSGGPSFLFTRLNKIKPAMIATATRAARAAAGQFAKDSGAKLGGIRRANQGVFQILARNNAPGLNAKKQIAKTVRVVSHVQYYLHD
jgi:hypothetical protein